MDHAAIGQRLDEPVGQGGFATIGDPARKWKNRIRTGSGRHWDIPAGQPRLKEPSPEGCEPLRGAEH